MKLTVLKEIPQSFSSLKVEEITSLFPGPTLIHHNEGKGQPIFISVLLHGNEHSGFLALQQLFAAEIERECLLFIANPQAAEKNLRFLEDQIDFNRVWSGGEHAQANIAKEVIDYVSKRNLYLSIDIHNNSGKNPFYSCVNRTDYEFLSLAQFFSPYIVYFTEPHEVQSMAFSKICPAITIEAGQSREPNGVKTLVKKLEEVLSWKTIPKLKNTPDLFHTKARLRIPHNLTYDFQGHDNGPQELSLRSDIEDYNFRALPVGFSLGYSTVESGLWLEGDCGANIFNEYFFNDNGEILVKKSFVPAMLTTNRKVIEQDCLGYIMESYR